MTRLSRFAVPILLQLVATPLRGQDLPAKPVVFVCEHGSVKSMIAAQWFNRMAAERGIRLQAVSRGVDPDAEIPEAVAANMRKDGFHLTGLVPVRLRDADLTQARYVVAIGAKSAPLDQMLEGFQRWDDIPPASVDYSAARDAMRARIKVLLDTLAPPATK